MAIKIDFWIKLLSDMEVSTFQDAVDWLLSADLGPKEAKRIANIYIDSLVVVVFSSFTPLTYPFGHITYHFYHK